MALFESKEQKQARYALAINRAKGSLKRHASSCRNLRDRFEAMARQAFARNAEADGDRYLLKSLQFARQAERTEVFHLKVEELSLASESSNMMSDLVGGLQALSKTISLGISPAELSRAFASLNANMATLEVSEKQLSTLMESLEAPNSRDLQDTASANLDLPEDLRTELAGKRQRLLDEVAATERAKPAVHGQTDDRIAKGMDRLRALRGTRNQ